MYTICTHEMAKLKMRETIAALFSKETLNELMLQSPLL